MMARKEVQREQELARESKNKHPNDSMQLDNAMLCQVQ